VTNLVVDDVAWMDANETPVQSSYYNIFPNVT